MCVCGWMMLIVLVLTQQTGSRDTNRVFERREADTTEAGTRNNDIDRLQHQRGREDDMYELQEVSRGRKAQQHDTLCRRDHLVQRSVLRQGEGLG